MKFWLSFSISACLVSAFFWFVWSLACIYRSQWTESIVLSMLGGASLAVAWVLKDLLDKEYRR